MFQEIFFQRCDMMISYLWLKAYIGDGSVITKDIPDNITAVGNYAKVINYSSSGRYVRNRWLIE